MSDIKDAPTSETALTFGAADGFGAFTGWELQSDTPNTQKDRASTTGPTGNEVSANLHNERTDYSSEYKASADSPTIPDTLGKLYNGRVLTSIAVKTSNSDRATMSLSGHQHAVNPHADTLQQVEHGIALATCFGAIDFMAGTGSSGASVASGSITIACQHNDALNAAGDHLVGENYTGMMDAQTTWVGTVATPADTVWDATAVEVPVKNTNFVGTSVTGKQPLALASPSA